MTDKKPSADHGVVNVKTKEKTVLKLPDDQYITDWSRDGKHLVTTRVWPEAGIFLMNGDGTEHEALTAKRLPAGKYGLLGRLSPDGKRLLFTIVTPGEKDKFGAGKRELAVAIPDNVRDLAARSRRCSQYGELEFDGPIGTPPGTGPGVYGGGRYGPSVRDRFVVGGNTRRGTTDGPRPLAGGCSLDLPRSANVPGERHSVCCRDDSDSAWLVGRPCMSTGLGLVSRGHRHPRRR